MTSDEATLPVWTSSAKKLRNVLLRVLLWSLAIAAVCGAIAVLVADARSIQRVMTTAMLTAGASLLMLGAALLVERPLSRLAGLVGMAAVVLEFVLVLALLWLPFANPGSERVALTIGCIAAAVLPAMLFLVMARIPQARIAGQVGVVSSFVIGVLLMAAVWLDGSPWRAEHLCWLAASIATFFPAAVLCLVGAGTDRRHWRWLGVAGAVVACAAMFYAFVWHPDGGESLFAALVSLTIVVAHANVLMLLPLKRGQQWLRWATIAATIATAVFIDLVFVAHDRRHTSAWFVSPGLFERWAGACGIVAGCGTLALLVLGRLNRKVQQPVRALETITEVTLVCPACGKKQTVPVGDGRCTSCNVIIFTRFTEPRCRECDYSLLMLNSDRCPECGTPVHEASGAGTGAVVHVKPSTASGI